MCCGRSLSVVKAKCSRIVCKEVDKAVDDNVTGACRRVMEVTLYDNVFSSLNFSFTTWAASGKVGEESLSIFSNRSVVMPLENFLQKCSIEYTLYPWILLLEPTLRTSYKPQT